MPPKKKPAYGKKKTAAKATADLGDSTEMSLEDKLLKAYLEIDSLQHELEMKNDLNIRLRQQLAEHRQHIHTLDDQLEIRTQDRLELTSDMSRQYKSMQAEMVYKVNTLENTVAGLKSKLVQAQSTCSEEKQAFDIAMSEKCAIIEEQSIKMTYMTNEFETMLNETLGRMAKKLELASQRWKDHDQITLSDANAKRLEDFQLTRIALSKIEI
ncbi:hypothetical protein BASA61_009749 [Batrachochytrium salamandrivorans]|nr:hypothetical protein BASA60_006286 [Batrachochytrium salamandrivorans]KAH6580286.1 hypothetical protein BASA61_009749 [Batrachochytrium salamandrivorans]KAJ1340684.1 hypothetical protein BSLG_004778 [Batrachochytrium salamandrivorans]